jgi:hypothetical protein
MTLDEHVATLAVTTLGIGWMMTYVGLKKSALELRHRNRRCPSCGRQISARVCTNCT